MLENEMRRNLILPVQMWGHLCCTVAKKPKKVSQWEWGVMKKEENKGNELK